MTHRAPLSFEPDWMLVGRFFRDACTPEEAEAITRWETASDANARLLEFMRQVWRETAIEWPPIDEADAWKTVRARMAAATRPVVVRPLSVLPGGVERSRASRFRRLLVAGVVAAVIATAGAVTWIQVEANRVATQPAREYVTARGQRGELLLVDGTRVWLSVDSRLRVRPGYGDEARDVELEGEAYFVVEHDSTRPFRVYTRGAVSEDLGTEFNVRAYASDEEVRVVVTEGRVALRGDTISAAADAGVELERGQMGRLDGAGRISVEDDVDLATVLGWREGGLRFKRRPVSEVLREIERWYDLEIVLEDSSLAPVLITTSLGRRTADQALAIIARVLDVRYTRDDRLVRFLAEPARHSRH